MTTNITYLPYSDTGYFSSLVIDYLHADPRLQDYYAYSPDAAGLAAAIQQRAQYPVNRQLLAETLTTQYTNLNKQDAVLRHLDLLPLHNTFTVCTAHQPNLLTGYLYFVYKILHAIKLARQLSASYPQYNFVPVYYMGSEDNDLEELGTFQFSGNKYIWDGNGQTGAVGRMKTEGLKTLLNDVFRLFGPPGENCEELKSVISAAYLQHKTIAEATQYLVNELFGRYGLLVLNPDDAALKKSFIPVMLDDLLHQRPYAIVSQTIEGFSDHYRVQASPRPVNLFYLTDKIRERIEKEQDHWHVVNTKIKWDEKTLMEELNSHPERFSPNVILRGAFQESILPNVAFIGGGAEVAYWLQLRALFRHYHIYYPCVLLRQSVLWVDAHAAHLQRQLQLSAKDIFRPETELVRCFIEKNSSDDWQTAEESLVFEKLLAQLKQKAITLDPTLKASAEAALAKIRRQLAALEKKMLRAEKKKMQTHLLKINRLVNHLFPKHHLQERVENFMDYFLKYGFTFFDILLDAMEPEKSQFLVLEADK